MQNQTPCYQLGIPLMSGEGNENSSNIIPHFLGMVKDNWSAGKKLDFSFTLCRTLMLRVDAKQGAPKEGHSPLELFQVLVLVLLRLQYVNFGAVLILNITCDSCFTDRLKFTLWESILQTGCLLWCGNISFLKKRRTYKGGWYAVNWLFILSFKSPFLIFHLDFHFQGLGTVNNCSCDKREEGVWNGWSSSFFYI